MSRISRFSARSQSDEGDGIGPWPAFGDIALSLILVFVLIVLAQFLRYDEIFVNEQLRARQDSIKMLVTTAIEEREDLRTTSSDVSFQAPDPYHQRIIFEADLLFATCSADVTGDGNRLITVVGASLGERKRYFETIRIEGHTDPQPISSRECRQSFEDNWALSAERATAVVRILAEPVSFGSPEILSSAGRAEYQPKEGSSLDAFDEHRRIEVVLQYTDEGLLGEDLPNGEGSS